MYSCTQGKKAEASACEYLQRQGLKCLARNYHCKMGEIDLIMQDKSSLVFVEVRFRSRMQFGDALESVTYHKQQKLVKAALNYLCRFNLTEKATCRFDVVAINESKILWIKDAFQMS